MDRSWFFESAGSGPVRIAVVPIGRRINRPPAAGHALPVLRAFPVMPAD